MHSKYISFFNKKWNLFILEKYFHFLVCNPGIWKHLDSWCKICKEASPSQITSNQSSLRSFLTEQVFSNPQHSGTCFQIASFLPKSYKKVMYISRNLTACIHIIQKDHWRKLNKILRSAMAKLHALKNRTKANFWSNF